MELKTVVRILIAYVIFSFLFCVGFAVWVTRASAQDGEWLRWKRQAEGRHIYLHSRVQRRASPSRTTRYYKAPEDPRCLGNLVAGTGQEATTEEDEDKGIRATINYLYD